MNTGLKSRKNVKTILFNTLKRVIQRKNYTSKEEMAEKLSLLYSAGKITDEQYIDLTFLLKGGEE